MISYDIFLLFSKEGGLAIFLDPRFINYAYIFLQEMQLPLGFLNGRLATESKVLPHD